MCEFLHIIPIRNSAKSVFLYKYCTVNYSDCCYSYIYAHILIVAMVTNVYCCVLILFGPGGEMDLLVVNGRVVKWSGFQSGF